MNFQCKELTIYDGEFVFEITFSDTKAPFEQITTWDELMDSKEKYLMISRSYPEDEFDEDFYNVESSETTTELGQRDNMTVRFSREKFEIDWSGEHLEIGLNLTEKEEKELRKAFKGVLKERTILLE